MDRPPGPPQARRGTGDRRGRAAGDPERPRGGRREVSRGPRTIDALPGSSPQRLAAPVADPARRGVADPVERVYERGEPPVGPGRRATEGTSDLRRTGGGPIPPRAPDAHG